MLGVTEHGGIVGVATPTQVDAGSVAGAAVVGEAWRSGVEATSASQPPRPPPSTEGEGPPAVGVWRDPKAAPSTTRPPPAVGTGSDGGLGVSPPSRP